MNLDDRAELARLLPPPVARDLPGDRHHQLQEFVMSEIHRARRESPSRRRRPVLVTAALTAVVALVAVAGAAAAWRSGDGASAPPRAGSGQEFLLAAATTAQRQPEGVGTYWYVKIAGGGAGRGTPWSEETWTDRDGRTWSRDARTQGRVVAQPDPAEYSLIGSDVDFRQLQELPTTPEALRARVVKAADESGFRFPAGPSELNSKENYVCYGLVSLVSQLPAPPQVRAAAFRALATYPNVTNVGPVDGGVELRIDLVPNSPARLVIDPVTAQVRRTNLLADPNGVVTFSQEAGPLLDLSAGWTEALPA